MCWKYWQNYLLHTRNILGEFVLVFSTGVSETSCVYGVNVKCLTIYKKFYLFFSQWSTFFCVRNCINIIRLMNGSFIKSFCRVRFSSSGLLPNGISSNQSTQQLKKKKKKQDFIVVKYFKPETVKRENWQFLHSVI